MWMGDHYVLGFATMQMGDHYVLGFVTMQMGDHYLLGFVTMWMGDHYLLGFVTMWMGDHYVLGFAPAIRVLQSQIVCRFYKSRLAETINRGPPCVCTRKKTIYTPPVHVRVWCSTPTSPACTKSVRIFRVLDTVWRKK